MPPDNPFGDVPVTSIRGTLSLLATALLTAGAVLPAQSGAHAAPRAVARTSAACLPGRHGPTDVPAIAFGRKGGNILPFRVSIYGDGTLGYQGAARPVASSYAVRPTAVQGLARLAGAEGFWGMPDLIAAARLFPDSGSLYITVRSGCYGSSTRTVTLQGGAQDAAFQELFDTLTAASGLQR